MKKNKKFIIIILLVFMLCGCTQTLKDKDNKVIVNEKTGQSVTSNIICKPTDKDVIKLYEDAEVDISKLSECEKIKFASKYEGLWYNVFVRPLAYIIIKIGDWVNSYAISLMIITLLIRLALYPITRKTAMQSEKMKEAQPELKKLEDKYKDKTSQEDQMKKSQETMALYKKYNINPVSGCIFAFLQLPIFFAFLEAINRVPAIFENTFLTLQLGTTPWVGITGGSYQYIILNVLIAATTYFSFKNTSSDTAAMAGQGKMMTIFMTVFIIFVSFRLPAAIAIYWIVNSAFTIGQNLLVKRGKKDVTKA